MNLIFADGDSFFMIFLLGRWLCSVVNWRGKPHFWTMGSDGIPIVDTQDDPPVIRKKKKLEYGMKTDFGKKNHND